jgi:HSP20 family molecular chaperone IbpA
MTQTITNKPNNADTSNYIPKADILDHEAGLTLLMDVPGSDSVELEVQKGVLHMSARVEVAGDREGFEPLFKEYSPKSYTRSFTLPDEVDEEKITANIKDGVLRLELPKAEDAKPRRIEVKSE